MHISSDKVWNPSSIPCNCCPPHSIISALPECTMACQQREGLGATILLPLPCVLPLIPAEVLVRVFSRGKVGEKRWGCGQPPQRCVFHLLAMCCSRYVYWNVEVHLCMHEERREKMCCCHASPPPPLFFFLRKDGSPPFNACKQKSFEQTKCIILGDYPLHLWFVSHHLFEGFSFISFTWINGKLNQTFAEQHKAMLLLIKLASEFKLEKLNHKG